MKICSEVKDAFTCVTADFPAELFWLIRNNEKRLLWQVQTVFETVRPGGKILDIGGGIVPFMATCQKLGYETYVVDDFSDPMYTSSESKAVLEMVARGGVSIVNANVFDLNIDDFPDDLAMVTTHDSMEHWHNSPKRLFHTLWQKLTPEGVFWVGVPNAVNLRKRMSIPFGFGSWSTMEDWYQQEVFRGHVREPVVRDLHYIASDLGARRRKIEGKNWLAYRHPNRLVKKAAPFFDRSMQMWPAICSDIYLTAWK